MKTKLLTPLLFLSYFGFSQTTSVTLSLPNLDNEFEIKLEKNVNEGLDAYIIDSKVKNVLHKLTFEKDSPISSFTKEVYKEINTTSNYFFKTADVVIKLSKPTTGEFPTVGQFADGIASVSDADFTKLVKAKTVFNNDPKTTFVDYLKKIATVDKEIEVFKGNTKFKFRKVTSNKVDLYYDGTVTTIKDIKTEDGFYKSFYDTYHTNTDIIKSILVTADLLKIDYNTTSNTLKLEDFYKNAGDKKSDFDLIGNYSIKKTSDSTTKSYLVSIKKNLQENGGAYLLKFCNSGHECKVSDLIPDSTEKTDFQETIKNFIKHDLLDSGYEMTDENSTSLYNKIKTYNNTKNKEEENKDVMEAVKKAENPEVSFSGIAILHDSAKLVPLDGKGENLDLLIHGASIRFFNNRINTLSVDGHVKGDDPSKTITFENVSNSIPFKYLNPDKGPKSYFLKVKVNDVQYKIDCDDILDYTRKGADNNRSVKNKSYALTPKDSVKIESRNLFDYFTAIIFSDFLGVNDTGNNSLLVAEGRAVIPLEYTNRGNFNGPHYFEGYLNTSLYNGQEEGKNFVEWKSQAANGGNYDKIAMFEFYKKRNVEAGLNFGIFAIEWKGISTNIVLDYGVQFYRTRVRYIKDAINTTEDYQVYSIGHGPKIKFEIRPQVNFGADLNIGFMGYNYNGINSGANLNDELRHHVINDKPTFLNSFYILSNFYTKLNDKEKNNGLYFRLGAVYDFETSDVSPQIMVGYATNLTSFINKFKKKDDTAAAGSK